MTDIAVLVEVGISCEGMFEHEKIFDQFYRSIDHGMLINNS